MTCSSLAPARAPTHSTARQSKHAHFRLHLRRATTTRLPTPTNLLPSCLPTYLPRSTASTACRPRAAATPRARLCARRRSPTPTRWARRSMRPCSAPWAASSGWSSGRCGCRGLPSPPPGPASRTRAWTAGRVSRTRRRRTVVMMAVVADCSDGWRDGGRGGGRVSGARQPDEFVCATVFAS